MKFQVTVRQRKCEVITGPAGSVTGVARNVQFIAAMVNKRINERIEILRIYQEHMFNSSKYA